MVIWIMMLARFDLYRYIVYVVHNPALEIHVSKRPLVLHSCFHPLCNNQHQPNSLHACQPCPDAEAPLNVIPCDAPRRGYNPANHETRQGAQEDGGLVQPFNDVNSPAGDEPIVGALDLQNAVVEFLRHPVAPEQFLVRTGVRQMMQEDVGRDWRRFERAWTIVVALGNHLGFAWDGHGFVKDADTVSVLD